MGQETAPYISKAFFSPESESGAASAEGYSAEVPNLDSVAKESLQVCTKVQEIHAGYQAKLSHLATEMSRIKMERSLPKEPAVKNSGDYDTDHEPKAKKVKTAL